MEVGLQSLEKQQLVGDRIDKTDQFGGTFGLEFQVKPLTLGGKHELLKIKHFFKNYLQN